MDKAILRSYGRKLKPSGIAVYNGLALFSNSKTQTCFPTQKSLASLTGLSRRTVARKITLLEKSGLISVEKAKGRLIYRLLEPDKKGCAVLTQGCDKKCIRNVTPVRINKKKLTRINNNVNVIKNFSGFYSFKGTVPATREELLALDLARGLDDLKNLPLYFYYAKKFPEFVLRRTLGEIKELSPDEIKKSKGALFTHLLKRYERREA